MKSTQTVRVLLQDVWSELRKAGIFDDYEIIEYIAALLTEGQQSLAEDLRPQKAQPNNDIDEDKLKRLLNEASDLVGGKAVLFDHYILFQSVINKQEIVSPRHIVNFMLALLKIEPEHSLADFCCGSGGFLVNRDGVVNKNQGQTAGVEISQNMARIAGANAVLHGIHKGIHIYVGNAFRVCSPSGELANSEFDRIAMIPPFAAKSEYVLGGDLTLIEKTLGIESKNYWSENLFTRLALKKLAPHGRAIIMVPSGLLFREHADLSLRKTMIDNHELCAVIFLNKGVLYPTTSIPVNFLLLDRTKHWHAQICWFFKLDYDGYPLVRSRDLSQPSTEEKNDLPLIQTILGTTEDQLLPVPLEENIAEKIFVVKPFLVREQFAGIAIKVRESAIITSLKLFRVKQKNSQANYILTEATGLNEVITYLVIPLTQDCSDLRSIRYVHNEKAWLHDLSKRSSRVDAGTHLFGPGQPGQTVVVANDGRLLGLTQSYATIKEANYHLHPEHYIRSGKEVEQPPAMMLNDILRNQHTVARYVDQLLGNLEIKPVVEQSLPPRLYDLSSFKISSFLGPEQRIIWERVLLQVDPKNKYALYFTLNEVLYENETKTQQALDLFERLGLIVRVTVSHPNTGRIASYYRRVTELDVANITNKREKL